MNEQNIDFDANFEHPGHLLSIFAMYNQEHIKQGTPWTNWPEWELCLTTMNDDFHFNPLESQLSDVVTEAKYWLALMEFIHDNPSISFDNYTMYVKGQHGNTFSFDFCLSAKSFTAAKTLDDFLAKRGYEPVKYDFEFKDPFNEWTHCITQSRGEMWVCPEHVPSFGGMSTEFTFKDTFCFQWDDQCFPAFIKGLIHYCIDDNAIWAEQFILAKAHANAIKHDMEQWPLGRPEDAEYQ